MVKVELEVMGGRDLKDNGVADGEEIGGSFVIVNGDSGDLSDWSDLDPATKSEEPLDNEKNESWLNGETRNIPLENAECTALCHVGVRELVEEVRRSASDVESESASESAESSDCVDSYSEGDQSTNKDDEEEATRVQVHAAETVQAPRETHVVEQPFAYMVKVPRLVDNELQKQIQEAQEMVDQKTKIRDEVRIEARKKEAKYFKMYTADHSIAINYKYSGDSQGLRSHCNRQVEKMMDLWNNNAEFREQYMKSNMYNTLRRLGTSDGRRLGPGEEAPILRYHVDRSSNIISAPSSNIQRPVPALASEVRQGNFTEPSATKREARTNQSAKSKSSVKSASAEGGLPTVSNCEESKGEEKENNKVKKEEEEKARKAEELARKEEELRKAKDAKEEESRKEKAAAELKEQLRLEQKAKAREAEERKRRKAEKAQAKAEYRAQKEAELKEQKKTKKENKKSGAADMPNGGAEGVSAPVPETNPPETSQEPETSGAVTRKRSTRPALSMRQYNKVQAPLPLPLRNRSKRKMTTWMWALLVVLLVLVLFIAGNYISFSTSGMPDFGF